MEQEVKKNKNNKLVKVLLWAFVFIVAVNMISSLSSSSTQISEDSDFTVVITDTTGEADDVLLSYSCYEEFLYYCNVTLSGGVYTLANEGLLINTYHYNYPEVPAEVISNYFTANYEGMKISYTGVDKEFFTATYYLTVNQAVYYAWYILAILIALVAMGTVALVYTYKKK